MSTKTPEHHLWTKKTTLRQTGLLVGLATALILVFIIDLTLGSVAIPLKQIIQIIAGQDSGNFAWNNIIHQIRVPQAISAMLAGAALSLGGLQMQTLFRNPLAGPSILGITAGSSLGVAIVMLASGSVIGVTSIVSTGLLSSWLIVIAAVTGSAMVLALVLLISLRIRDNVVVLIVGMMVGNITIALVSVWQYFSEPEQIQDYLMWTFGSLGGVTHHHLTVLSTAVGAGILLSILITKTLNTLLLGENYAQSLGLSVRRARILVIAITSLLAGSVTAFCGPIGFVGIAVPHLTRSLLNSSDHRLLVPAVCMLGAVLMLICDIIAKVPGSHVTLPINAVTALVGAPVVIFVIVKRRNLRASF
ncbi:iron ABC transporter permease [uncultured Microscilla sp.]|uniref:FecCD family ABC transporter permease n=1 Tax=uncultured Microscilla sp. TaxID=432653 RepID=UPI0026266E6A|nr:iron ABC transporter permease [uncultured Microscilla sp.]